jgi:hypothetical protein
MVSSRHVLAIAIAFFLASDPSSARVAAVGFVSHADRAHIGAALASSGTSVYDGDRLSTEADGFLRLTLGASALHLAPQTSLTLHRSDSAQDTEVELAAGTLIFSSAKPPAIAVRADAAWIRCAASFPVAAQIGVVNAKELTIRAQRGSLEFTYGGETEVIPEGIAYRVVLDPDEDPANASANGAADNPKPRKPYLLIAVAAVAAAAAAAAAFTTIILTPNYQSPDRPGTAPATVPHH